VGDLTFARMRPRALRRSAGLGLIAIAALGCHHHASPTAPTVAISASPDGQAVAGVTVVVFTAAASDTSGGALTLSWDFGDGQTASGASATHVYVREGVFAVSLTASNNGGGSTAAGTSVTVGNLTGRWLLSEGGWKFYEVGYDIVQSGPLLSGRPYSIPDRGCLGDLQGRVNSPRGVTFAFEGCDGETVTISGTASGDLRVIPGTYAHPDVATETVRLTRQ
jgi:PKD repeat protein